MVREASPSLKGSVLVVLWRSGLTVVDAITEKDSMNSVGLIGSQKGRGRHLNIRDKVEELSLIDIKAKALI